MATTGFASGSLINVYLDGTKIVYGSDHELSITRETRSYKNKDSTKGWDQKKYAGGSWQVSGNHLFSFDAAYGYEDLFTLMDARTEVDVKFTTNVSGDDYMTGTGIITSLTKAAADDETITYSYTIEGSGEITSTQLT